MRKVIAAAFVSLDGVMQAPGGPDEDPTGGFKLGGWTVNYWDNAMMEEMGAKMSAPYDLLLGRKTYEIFAAYWPFRKGDPISDKFNAVTKYVATGSQPPLTWQNTVSLGADGAGAVAKLKQADGPNLLIQGSSQFIQSLLAANLIDEFRLMVFPLILGPGKRLFGSGAKPDGLKLVESKVSGTGVVMATYVPAGAIRPGSFAMENPSDAERARIERMKREG